MTHNPMKRPTLLLLGAMLLGSAISQATDIRGKASVSRKAVISVACSTDTAAKVQLQADTKTYSVTLSPQAADIATFFVVYEDSSGTNRQMYTPFYVDPTVGEVVIDITENGAEMQFTTTDPDTRAFLQYSVFLRKQFMAQVTLADAETYLQTFSDKAHALVASMEHPLSASYMELWAASSRNMAAMSLKRQLSDKMEPDKKYRWGATPSPERLLSNPATRHFPEFVNAVAAATATGSDLRQRIANMRRSVSDPMLSEIIEHKLIQRFVSSGGEQGVDIDSNLATLDSVASHRPEYPQWREKLASRRSYTQAGDLAPDDILLDPSGNPHRLSDFRGKNIFIDLWASWCVYCIREFPALHEVEKTFSGDDIIFISLSMDSNSDAWHSALNRLHLQGNQYIVSSPSFSEKLGISAIPRYLLYDRQGRLVDGDAPRPSETQKITDLLRSLK